MTFTTRWVVVGMMVATTGALGACGKSDDAGAKKTATEGAAAKSGPEKKWTAHEEADGKFKVEAPERVSADKQELPIGRANVPLHTVSYASGDAALLVSYMDLPNAELLGRVADLMAKNETRGKKVLAQGDFNVGDATGKSVSMEIDTSEMVKGGTGKTRLETRVIGKGTRLFIVKAIVPPTAKMADAKRFLESFQMR